MKTAFSFLLLTFLSLSSFSQENKFEKFNFLIGKWEGSGTGFGASKSVIASEFNWIMNQQYIEVKNRSVFEPTNKNPKGEIHEDWGIISYDNARKLFVFRQFHVEGFVNQYILNDSLSDKSIFVFDSEIIENFVPGGKARFSVRIKNESEIETIFDVGMPGQEMSCYGQNKLRKQ